MEKIKEINFVFFITVLVSLSGSVLSAIILQKIGDMGIVLLLSQIILAMPTILYFIKKNESLGIQIRLKRLSASQGFGVFLFTMCILPAMNLLNACSLFFVKNQIQNTIEPFILQNPLWLSLLLIAVIPAILEECVYRGVFYQEYAKNSKYKGMVLSACLFGCMHMNWNQFFYAFLLGMLFALLIEATGSIVSSMLAHFLINASSVLSVFVTAQTGMLHLQQEQSLEKGEFLKKLPGMAAIAILFFCMAMGILKGLVKNNTRQPSYEDEVSRSKHLCTPYMVIGIFICILVMIGNERGG